jgi:hypothetical protein
MGAGIGDAMVAGIGDDIVAGVGDAIVAGGGDAIVVGTVEATIGIVGGIVDGIVVAIGWVDAIGSLAMAWVDGLLAGCRCRRAHPVIPAVSTDNATNDEIENRMNLTLKRAWRCKPPRDQTAAGQ